MDSERSSDSCSSSTSCSDDDFEEFVEDFNEFGIRPYQFEPQRLEIEAEDSREDESTSESDEENNHSRLTNSEWYVLGFLSVYQRNQIDWKRINSL